MWADPIVTRYIGGRPRTREESWIRFLRQFGMWPLLGFGFWAIEEKATGRFIGEAGFHDLKRDMAPSIEGIPEAGWALVPAAHGKGLATEVVRCAVAWGDDNLDAEKTVCIVDARHGGSIAVAEKCGYAELSAAPSIMATRQSCSSGRHQRARDEPRRAPSPASCSSSR